MRRNALILSALVLALAQIAFLSWTIIGRAAVLRDGREILLKAEPIDPRDLLRGDYVILGYDISSIPIGLIGNAPARGSPVPAGPIYVRVSKGGDGFWHAASAWLGEPGPAPAGSGEVELRGDTYGVGEIYENTSLGVTYGIERYYVPEGEGLAIQEDMRERNFGMKVAVSQAGVGQIKALMDGDKMLYEEPLY